jgi:hypothetical protein
MGKEPAGLERCFAVLVLQENRQHAEALKVLPLL